jgi:hypothetical protein
MTKNRMLSMKIGYPSIALLIGYVTVYIVTAFGKKRKVDLWHSSILIEFFSELQKWLILLLRKMVSTQNPWGKI